MDWTVRGSNCSRGKRIFSSPECPDWLWGPPSFLFIAYRGSLLGVQWLGHEIYHSPVSGAEVKNEWNCTSTPLCPHGMDNETGIFFFTLCWCSHSISSSSNILWILCILIQKVSSLSLLPTVFHFQPIESSFHPLSYSMWQTQIGTWNSEEPALSIFMVLPLFYL